MDTSGQLRAAASREGSTFEAQRLRRALEQRLFRAGMPTRLGRYELERLVGRGGMGSVYAAWDPQLERRVAIKLLAGPSNEDARARLQREAMALAFLSHPHVVAVYEVVAVAEEAFVVMELVDGEPLSRWLARHAHFDRARAREVMELLLQAGRGLAAAHRAGLVHRDVKPSNILVGSDGRVRVADFGLVRLSTPQTPGDDVGASTNDLVGTPAYMSPEQIDGEVVDARSDQFSFCVTAFEAITGELPFAGATVSARREAMRRSSHPRARGVVSRRVHDILARGLAERSVDRFADMGELVRRLDAARRPFVSPTVALLSIGALAAIGAATIERRNATVADPCAERAPLSRAWHDRDRAVIADAVARSDLDERAAAALDDALGRYALRFDDAWQRACEREVPRERDDRLACLVQRRDELGIVVAELRDDPKVLREQGVTAVHAVASPEACNRVRADELQDDLARELAAALASARADARAGRHPAAIARTLAVSARAMASGRVAMDARARLDISDVLDDLGHPRAAASWATIAYELATAAGDDRTAALAAFATLSLASVLREDDRATWRRHSDAALARVDDPALTAEYWRAVSWAAAAERRADEAEEALRRAIAVSDSVDQPLARVGDLLDLGETMLIRHRYAEALALHREAYELAAQVAGPRHPIALRVRGELANSLLFVDAEAARRELDVLLVEVPAVLGEESSAYAAVLARYGTLELRANELDAGIAHIERSTEIFARIHGPWSSAQAANRYQLGYAHLVRGDSVRAEVELREALAIQERVDSDGPAIVQPAIALASIASDRQDWKTAIALMRRALSVLGDDPSDGRIAEVLYQLAAAELDSGDFEAARTTVARALPITAASFGTPSNRMAELRALVADLHEHDGDVVAAIAEYREVEAMMLASPPMRWRGIGFARGRLAELQWKAGDRREARAMAGAAIQAYEQAEGTAEAIAVLRTWLAEHPLRR